MKIRAALEAAHVSALGVWLGSLVMTGAAAAISFPTMRELDPILPGYGDYTGAHWSLAAGRVMQRVFYVNDVVQFVCAMAAGVSLLVLIAAGRLSLRRWTTFVRAAAVLAAVGLAAYGIIGLAPRMNENLRAYWSAAAAGDDEAAARPKAAFDADHPRASLVLKLTAAALVAGLCVGSWDAARGAQRAGSAPGEVKGWEEPALAKSRRRA